jgi:hypothetical protein
MQTFKVGLAEIMSLVLIMLLLACGSTNARISAIKDGNLSQEELSKIAIEDEDQWVRKAAVEKLTDKTLLWKICINAKAAVEVRDAAWKKLDNLRRAPMENLDQTSLTKIAIEDKDIANRKIAVEKLTDQTLLSKIAINDKNEWVRTAAVDKLTDQTLLSKIAIEDEDHWVRQAAVKKLTDQALLLKIAINDKEVRVRDTAESKLTDKTYLCKHVFVGKTFDREGIPTFIVYSYTVVDVSPKKGTATVQLPNNGSKFIFPCKTIPR